MGIKSNIIRILFSGLTFLLILVLSFPVGSQNPSGEVIVINDSLVRETDSIASRLRLEVIKELNDSLNAFGENQSEFGEMKVFNPDPNRAMWLSLLCPGLGQVYNRRYWKLPIVVGGFVGLGYAMSWNNRMHSDYTKAYRDIMDNDPATNSYMDFYPPTVKEGDIDRDWLKRVLKSKKDYFRRNKELCVISMVGMYLLCVVDAYVDASLMNFDISEDLSMQVKPAVIVPQLTERKLPSMGLQCAFSF